MKGYTVHFKGHFLKHTNYKKDQLGFILFLIQHLIYHYHDTVINKNINYDYFYA